MNWREDMGVGIQKQSVCLKSNLLFINRLPRNPITQPQKKVSRNNANSLISHTIDRHN